ncbi:MAG: YHS domain-containing protein [Bryobacteraceae bacterium]
MTKDPVCGMQVDENKAVAASSYQGKKYSFCGQDCKNKFDSEPQRYAQQQDKQQPGKQPEHANR